MKKYGSIPFEDNPQTTNSDGLPASPLSWNVRRTAVLVGMLLAVAAVLLLNLAETVPRNVVLDEPQDGAAEPLPANVQDILGFVDMDDKRQWYCHFRFRVPFRYI